MGKSSRRKRERKKGFIHSQFAPSNGTFGSAPLFRLFHEEQHADSFVRGQIRLGTLGACRAYEGAGRGDRGEGTVQFHSGHITSEDPGFAAAAAKFGIKAGTFHNCSISNSTAKHSLPDAYVVCLGRTTPDEQMIKEFGRHCVQVFDVQGLFMALHKSLSQSYRVKTGRLAPVSYVGRDYDARVDPTSHIGFLKPAEGYSYQNEVRMLWEISEPIEKPHHDIDIGDASAFCRRFAIGTI